MKIVLDGKKENKGHVFVYELDGRLRYKFWFYGDGTVNYREWDSRGRQLDHNGDVLPLDRLGERYFFTLEGSPFTTDYDTEVER